MYNQVIMSKISQREFFQESIDSWRQSANHDKKQALLSFMIAAVGVVPATIGAEALFTGDVVGGLVGIAVGGAFVAGAYTKVSRN
jgi:hypothetical protein